MTTETTVTPTPSEDAPLPWETGPTAPTTRSSIHVLADEPRVTYHDYVYPSFSIADCDAVAPNASFTLSATGNAEQRRRLAESLREMADRIEQWAPGSKAAG